MPHVCDARSEAGVPSQLHDHRLTIQNRTGRPTSENVAWYVHRSRPFRLIKRACGTERAIVPADGMCAVCAIVGEHRAPRYAVAMWPLRWPSATTGLGALKASSMSCVILRVIPLLAHRPAISVVVARALMREGEKPKAVKSHAHHSRELGAGMQARRRSRRRCSMLA